MSNVPQLPDVLLPKLREALALTDKVAFYNVTHDDVGDSILDVSGNPIEGKFSRGGPFGAMLGISLEDGRFEPVGEARGNNVVGSGIASRHAENEALQADNIGVLKSRLSELRTEGHNPLVWMISSGQSCITCHTKQKILARNLESSDLISHGNFITLYGADYDETFDIAQFYDAQYADALIFSSLYPRNPANLIRQDKVECWTLPDEIQTIFKKASSPTAVIVHHGQVYAIGREARTDTDLFATAEVNAIREACKRNRSEGAFDSWSVDGVLYTTSSEIGPLLFAEAGWTNVNLVKSVNIPYYLANKAFDTRETSSVSNAELLRIVAGGYAHDDAAVRVVRDKTFVNTAQPQWANILKVRGMQLYNGAAVSPEVEEMRDLETRFRFAAPDLCNCGGGLHRPTDPLKELKRQRSMACEEA